MKLTREQVAHIAELARLSLTDQEVALYQEQLAPGPGHGDHPPDGHCLAGAKRDAGRRIPPRNGARGHFGQRP